MSDNDLPSIAKQLKTLDRQEMRAWLKRGELLTAAKALLVDDSSFRTWLRKNGQSKTTAYRALTAWAHFGECPDPGHFTKESMEILAQSEAARDQAIELAHTQKVTAKLARELVRRHCGTDATNPTPHAVEDHRHFESSITVLDSTVVIRSPMPITSSDQIAILSQALKQLTGYNAPPAPPATSPAISPLDRLRSRIAG